MNEKLLALKYIRRDRFVHDTRNAKQHDIGLITSLIIEHNFRVPITIHTIVTEHLTPYQKELHDNGEELWSVLAGHGRLLSLYHIEQQIKRGEIGLPDGLGIDHDGMLLIPATLGSDIEDDASYTAFIIDDNNVGMMGGNNTALDVSKLYDVEKYLKLLELSIDKVKTVDHEDLTLLQKLYQEDLEEPLEFDEPELPMDEKIKQYKHTLKFDTEIDLNDLKNWLTETVETYPTNTSSGFVLLDLAGLV